MKKYIEFENVADLTAKLEKLINYREKSLLRSRNWFNKHNIPYEVLPNGDLGIDLNKLEDVLRYPESEEVSTAYIKSEFEARRLETQQYYQELGVVFIDDVESLVPGTIKNQLKNRNN